MLILVFHHVIGWAIYLHYKSWRGASTGEVQMSLSPQFLMCLSQKSLSLIAN